MWDGSGRRILLSCRRHVTPWITNTLCSMSPQNRVQCWQAWRSPWAELTIMGRCKSPRWWRGYVCCLHHNRWQGAENLPVMSCLAGSGDASIDGGEFEVLTSLMKFEKSWRVSAFSARWLESSVPGELTVNFLSKTPCFSVYRNIPGAQVGVRFHHAVHNSIC